VGDEYNYSYPRRDRTIRSGAARVSVRERGPLRACLRVTTTMRLPASATPDRKGRSNRTAPVRIVSDLFLSHDAGMLEIVTTVENRARDHRLRVLFPTGVRTDTVWADSQFCVVQRRQKTYKTSDFTIEHPAAVAPMQRFVAASDQRRGLVILTDGLPEYELILDRPRTIAVTLLRCVGLLAGEDLLTRPGGKAGWHSETPDAQCQGTHTFRYAVLPLHTSWEESLAEVNQASETFHLPLLCVRRKDAALPPLRGSFCSIDNPRVVFSALKDAEEGEGIVLRCYNPSEKEERAAVRFSGAVRQAWQARLDETPVSQLTLQGDNEVPLALKPGEVVTLLVKMAP
jgi:alpha-mannosidase